MKPKSPEQAAWDAECKRLLKKITRIRTSHAWIVLFRPFWRTKA